MDQATPVKVEKYGLLPTPPLPDDVPQVQLTENARQVLARRYVRRNQDGKPAESVEEMFWRVAYHVARVEEAWGGDVIERAHQFYALLTGKQFFPNSPTFTGAGTPLGQLAACFVLPIADDMGRHPAGIFQTLRDAALIQQTGGGNGFSFSRLRPQNTLVKSSAGQATGPVGFLRVYDKAFGEIAQGGTPARRQHGGAARRSSRISKSSSPARRMRTRSPTSTSRWASPMPSCRQWRRMTGGSCAFRMSTIQNTTSSTARSSRPKQAGIADQGHKRMRARDLFEMIVTPGAPQRRAGRAVPGRRQPLQPRAAPVPAGGNKSVWRTMVRPVRELLPGFGQPGGAPGRSQGTVDWEKLRASVALSTRFLDDVVDANAYVPAVPQLSQAAPSAARRIGPGHHGPGRPDVPLRHPLRLAERGRSLPHR